MGPRRSFSGGYGGGTPRARWHGAGGWRLGTFLFPPGLHWLRDAVAIAASETYSSVSAPIQHAAISAYQEDPALEDYLARSRRVLGALGGWCAAQLRTAGARCPDPEGGFYLLPDFSGLSESLAARGVHHPADFCRALLDETGVAVLPGTDFGRDASELTIRLAYVDFDGASALAAAPAQVDLDTAWLRANCPRVVDGIDRMVAWISA